MDTNKIVSKFTELIFEFSTHAESIKFYTTVSTWNNHHKYSQRLLLDKIKASYQKLNYFSKIYFSTDEKQLIDDFVKSYEEWEIITEKNILIVHSDLEQTINIIDLARFNFELQNKSENSVTSKETMFSNKKIFIVHGHDEGMKHEVARFIEKLKLKAIILSEQPDEGNTIIEKFEQNSDVSYAMILLSPDDNTGKDSH